MKYHNPIAATVAGLIFLCGCGRNSQESVPSSEQLKQVSPADLISLHQGKALVEVERLLGGTGKHQFSARTSDGDFVCLSYSFEQSHVRYYFLFRSNALEKIVTPPVREVELVPYRNVQLEIAKPLDAEKRMKTVLSAEALFGGKLVTSMKSALSPKTESFNVLPAFVAAGQFQNAIAVQTDYERNESLAKKFAPHKINLGDPEDALVTAYGPPLNYSQRNEGGGDYQFGSNEPLRVNPTDRFSGLAFVVEQGVITRIYSNDFFEQTSPSRLP